MFSENWPLIVGSCLMIIIGEFMVRGIRVTYGKVAKVGKYKNGKGKLPATTKRKAARRTR